jgi:hypothetical protein
MYMACPSTKFNMPRASPKSHIVITPTANGNHRMISTLLFYIMQKHHLKSDACFSSTNNTYHFETLNYVPLASFLPVVSDF